MGTEVSRWVRKVDRKIRCSTLRVSMLNDNKMRSFVEKRAGMGS